MAEERRKEPIEYVREEADEETGYQLERDASKEAVEEEEKTGGALPEGPARRRTKTCGLTR